MMQIILRRSALCLSSFSGEATGLCSERTGSQRSEMGHFSVQFASGMATFLKVKSSKQCNSCKTLVFLAFKRMSASRGSADRNVIRPPSMETIKWNILVVKWPAIDSNRKRKHEKTKTHFFVRLIVRRCLSSVNTCTVYDVCCVRA